MNEFFIQIAGVLGFITSVTMFFPMAINVWRYRKDDKALLSQSIVMQILWIANAIFWMIYGFGTGAIFSALPSFINLPLAVFNLYLVTHSRKKVKYSKLSYEEKPCACGYPKKTGHKLFVIAPPGYGSIVECNGKRRGFVVPIDDETVIDPFFL